MPNTIDTRNANRTHAILCSALLASRFQFVSLLFDSQRTVENQNGILK